MIMSKARGRGPGVIAIVISPILTNLRLLTSSRRGSVGDFPQRFELGQNWKDLARLALTCYVGLTLVLGVATHQSIGQPPQQSATIDAVADVPALAAAAAAGGHNNGNGNGENNTNTGSGGTGGNTGTGTVIGVIGDDDSGVQLAVQVDGTEKEETEAEKVETEEMEVEQQLATNPTVGQGGSNGGGGGGDQQLTIQAFVEIGKSLGNLQYLSSLGFGVPFL